MTHPLILGPSIDKGEPDVQIYLDRLIGNHACFMAMSGGGKSGLIRKTLEETHGHIQQIVLDPEDEFYTLREAFDDYLIAGGEGPDCPATLANAAALARMLLETGMNAVIQLNDLHSDDQERFVAIFIAEMMSAPRELWHPVLLVLDETHRFAPQDGYAASSAAVKDLTSRGRKRGFTAILATQRMAKIDKNVTGDVTNWMIGLVGQAADKRVAAEQLGFSPSSAEGKGLQMMPARNFWAFGPAWSVPPRLFRVADTITTIVKPGQARLPTPPAPEKMQEIMAAMAAAAAPPPETASEPAAEGGRSDNTPPPGWVSPEDHSHGLERSLSAGFENGMVNGQLKTLEDLEAWLTGERRAALADMEAQRTLSVPRTISSTSEEAKRYADAVRDIPSTAYATTLPSAQPERLRVVPAAERPNGPGAGEIVKMKKATVDTIAVYEKVWPRILPWKAAAKLAGVGLNSSQFKVYEPEAIASGQLERIGDGYRARRGVPGGAKEMVDAYRAQLSPAYRSLFDAIAKGGATGRCRRDIVEEAGVSPTSSTTSAALRQFQEDLFVEHRGGDLYGLTEAFQ
jgi:hypothetical protein